MSSIV
jgi:hypothetical protein